MPGGLFLTGGSTARACLLALGVSGLRPGARAAAGHRGGRGAWRGLGSAPVITKSAASGRRTRSAGWSVPLARRIVSPRPLGGAPPVA